MKIIKYFKNNYQIGYITKNIGTLCVRIINGKVFFNIYREKNFKEFCNTENEKLSMAIGPDSVEILSLIRKQKLEKLLS